MVGSRTNRADDLLWLGGGENELDVRRRLLNQLQQSVEALRRDHVGLVDDVNLVAAGDRGKKCAFAKLTGVIHTAVASRVDLDDVNGAWPARRQIYTRLADATRVRSRALFAVKAAGQDSRGRGFTATAGAAEQICVIDLVIFDRPHQRFGDVILTDDFLERVRAVTPIQRQVCVVFLVGDGLNLVLQLGFLDHLGHLIGGSGLLVLVDRDDLLLLRQLSNLGRRLVVHRRLGSVKKPRTVLLKEIIGQFGFRLGAVVVVFGVGVNHVIKPRVPH